MSVEDWPSGLYPRSQKYGLSHKAKLFQSFFTGHLHVIERKGTRWTAELTFVLEPERAAVMDALIARLKTTGQIRVPDFRRIRPSPVTDSMDDYAAEIGPTFFDDDYDFDDETQDVGFLNTEQSPPIGTEDNALFGGNFDAALLLPGNVLLLTETGELLLADNVGIPFETDKGFILTIEHGDALEIAIEDGFSLQAQNDDYLMVQRGGGFFEGAGQPVLVTGDKSTLAITGLAPWRMVISAGNGIQTSENRFHLILDDVVTDINGAAIVRIAPDLREAVTEQPLIVGGVRALMRLTGDNAGENTAIRPNISKYTLTFEEILI